MIKFTLSCDKGHQFESWFQSGQAYETLRGAGHLACVDCGSKAIDKTVMAPALAKQVSDVRPVATPENPLEKLRDKVEAEADYVGKTFATKARAMHDGTMPDRPIYGEANLGEAKALLSDGVPILPLPFIPRKKTN